MIKLNSVTKKFYLESRKSGLLVFLTNLFKSTSKECRLVLNNASLDLQNSEVVGLIGKNGSGKSTLLKIISGIVKPTSGNLLVEGDVVYLSGFYNGMNKNLSMKDNIYIIGTLNGLSKNEITNRLKIISEFSELSEFIDTPLYKFSNGMIARLAFSTTIFTIQKSPEILLIDEALSGGIDESFKEKLLQKIHEYIESAKTVIIASHNLNYVSKMCSKTIWLHNGKVKMFGNTNDVVSEYKNFMQ